MNHICCMWRYRDLTEKTGRVTNHQTTSSPWNRFAFNFGMRRCQIPSISPPLPRNGVSLGKGSGDFDDKSRTTPFKSCEAYVKCTRDNRLCRGTCLTFLSGTRCFCETRERSPRMFTWTRFCQKASSPRSLSAAATLVAISRAAITLVHSHGCAPFDLHRGIYDEWYWSRSTKANSPSLPIVAFEKPECS